MDTGAGMALFAGLHFDRRRFARDIQLFEGKKGRHHGQERVEAEEAEGDHDGRTSQRGDDSGPASTSKAEGDGGRKMDEVERVALLRKRHRIHVMPRKAPAPLDSFAELAERYGCSEALLEKLQELHLDAPTPIQRQAIPVLLEGQECFACAPTGSGKTLAYALPIVQSLKKPIKHAIRALVLSPTRELAAQIVREFKRITPACRLKVRLLTKAAARCNDLVSAPGCDILVATPLRLASLLGDTPKIDLGQVQHLVLDEADKLFEMGFVEQIDAVIAACSSAEVVRSLFSATLPETVEQLARTIMHDPCRIVVGERNAATSAVMQELLFVGSEEGKLLAMRQLLKEGIQPPVLVFVQSKERAEQLFRQLVVDEGLSGVGVIHSGRTQSQRDTVVDDFRSGKVWLLIATDLMGRGMDFKGVNLVINFDFPPSTAAYIHRVGRSGRAGCRGRAITFHTEEDKDLLGSISRIIAASGSEVPAWMLTLPKVRRRRRPGQEQRSTEDRKQISSMHGKAQKQMAETSPGSDQVGAKKRKREAASQDKLGGNNTSAGNKLHRMSHKTPVKGRSEGVSTFKRQKSAAGATVKDTKA